MGFFLFLSCSPADRQAADRLNSLSYAYHYSSLDSTEHYAQQVMRMSALCADGKAEALNNLAFVRIAQMRYEEAEQLLSQIPDITDNQIELLVSYIQQMRLCQRRSHNRDFYDYRELANNALRRINEERATLDERQLARIVYAESEMAIVTSTYFYYVGLERQASQALEPMPAELERDTAQFLNYLYNVGAGGIITQGTQEDINQAEFDYLMRCFLLSQQSGIRYFEANSLEALAEHLIVAEFREQIVADNLPAMKFLAKPSGIAERIHSDDIPYDSLALYLAQASLDIFTDYGDVYQIAGAHRTLASCYLAHNDYGHALEELHLALGDTIINQAPDLVASIHEQLSVAYAAIDDKQHSDQHRNTYLDLQEQTRQDRSLEARAGNVIGGGDFAKDRIIPDCVRAAMNNEPIVVRNPHSTRPYQHVLEPLCVYLLIAMKQYLDKSCEGYYNVGPDDGDSFETCAIVDSFVKYWGNGLKWIDKNDGGPHEASLLKLDCTKIKSAFGWKPKWTLDNAVQKTVEWTKCYIDGGNVRALMDAQIEEYINS